MLLALKLALQLFDLVLKIKHLRGNTSLVAKVEYVQMYRWWLEGESNIRPETTL